MELISAGNDHAVAVKSDGTVWAWGQNSASNNLGLISSGGSNQTSPGQVQTSGVPDFVAISAGTDFTLALDVNGKVWAWGQDSHGELGNGTGSGSQTSPQACLNLTSDVIAIAAGDIFGLALKSDGTVWAWGWGSWGQLGDPNYLGIAAGNHTPTQISGLSNIVAIAVGKSFSAVLRDDGKVLTFGGASQGRLGNGTTTPNTATPQTVVVSTSPSVDLSGIVAISCGEEHVVALKNDGTVWAWGRGDESQIGQGIDSTVAIRVDQAQSSNPVLVTQWDDEDGDGWTRWQENLVGTNPDLVDSNQDGIPDKESSIGGLSPSDLDFDDDGLSNAQEIVLGTNMFVADSDGDTVNDGLDAFPLDPTRSQFPTGSPTDTAPR